VRSIEDPALIKHLRKEGIHLEVCPTCNVQTDVYPQYQDHPIHRLYDEGLSIGVNTDARTMVNITLSEEYQKLHETFGWGKEHFFRCNSDALRASFIAEKKKEELSGRLADEYGKA
jgi:adenosine deaminase